MKATGIVRKVDDLGRIVLPIELRRVLDLDKGADVEIYTDKDAVILKKHQQSCIFCGSHDNLTEFKSVYVCADCRALLSK